MARDGGLYRQKWACLRFFCSAGMVLGPSSKASLRLGDAGIIPPGKAETVREGQLIRIFGRRSTRSGSSGSAALLKLSPRLTFSLIQRVSEDSPEHSPLAPSGASARATASRRSLLHTHSRIPLRSDCSQQLHAPNFRRSFYQAPRTTSRLGESRLPHSSSQVSARRPRIVRREWRTERWFDCCVFFPVRLESDPSETLRASCQGCTEHWSRRQIHATAHSH